MSADGGAPGSQPRKGADGEGDGARVTMADTDPSPSETIAVLQGEIDILKTEIKEGDAEMKAIGRDFEQRAAALKPKEDRLTELEKQKRIVMEQQQLQIQAGVSAPGEKRSTEDEKASHSKRRRVEKDVSKMIAGLRSFEVGELQPGSVVVLPPATVGSGESNKALYVREEYITALALWKKQRETLGGMLLVIGTPGIGKSLFGRLVFTLEMAREETVLWVTGEERILFHENQAINIDGVSDIGNKHSLKFADVIIVYDTVVGLHKFFGDQKLKFKCILALHSPSAEIESTKKQRNLSSMVLVMNPFIFSEAMSFRSRLMVSDPDAAPAMWDEEAFHAKFNLCGGSVRHLLLDTSELQRDITDAVDKMTNELLSDAVGGKVLSGDTGRICHRILHMWRTDTPDIRYVLRFCSNTVRDRVLDKIAALRSRELLHLANRVDINGSLRGQIWENRVHSMFCESKDTTFTVRDLCKGGSLIPSTMTIPSIIGSSIFDKIEDVDCKVGMYYRPKSSNFETVDAFFIFQDDNHGLTAVLVQSTVSTSHSVKLAGLKNVLSCITGGLGQVAKTLLVFLTPPVVFDKFSQHPQVITIKGGGAAANQDIVQQQVW
eukprot:CAMPEP_0182949262 /NCGR_PEP_ID=MMETSP0105_2-20130417/60173_1 /TAXON_ID=81532 ORGANISM="Acanthoeca-like sp., Strain 10tr" /NCGR_SAMPLE_ID=MMETSP0105_2 /ASSEMBLY_ACC=CAM_ASM_000205 /LENGTH=605 /DNA_ID=CAMNT_0025089559 /DNA_START=123 /DNA_END=1937 /DNA_ORIENTATION=-